MADQPPLSASEPCLRCEGRGWVVEADGGAGTARACSCRRDEELPSRQEAAGIAARYEACRLENFKTTAREPEHEISLQAALALSRRYVEEFLTAAGRFRESGLLYIGPPGVGKTHLAVATLRELIARYRARGRFVDFTTLIYQIQSTFDVTSPESKQSVLDPVIDAEVLVLDELGAQKPTPWVSEILYLVLNTRYTRRRPTLFTTNYRLEDEGGSEVSAAPLAASGRGSDLLGSRIPGMLLSRLYEMARPVVIDSVDYRRTYLMHQHRVFRAES